jgi:hypothetical protein
MTYLPTVLALTLWVLAIFAAWYGRWPLAVFLVYGVVCGAAAAFIGSFLSGLAMQFIVLTVVVLLVRVVKSDRAYRVMLLMNTATFLFVGIPCWFSFSQVQSYETLREHYPFESVEERLSELTTVGPRQPLPAAAERRLKELEQIAREKGDGGYRADLLKKLHADTVDVFMRSPGFGVIRMTHPTEERLRHGVQETDPVPQPVPRASPSGFPDGLPPAPVPTEDPVRLTLHRDSVLDFANLAASGYVKDRRHVAGFRPHRFSRVSEAERPLKVETVDLVSLLLHPEPAAYVSADLPRMDELRGAPTRPLDEFELAGLEQIRQGEDLVVGESGPTLRMLGSIRSIEQCVKCHGGERGDLLGAFSYTLARQGP